MNFLQPFLIEKEKDLIDISSNSLPYISKLLDDFKYKTEDLSYTEKRALQNSYNLNIGKLY